MNQQSPITYIGLDVHSESIAAFAISPEMPGGSLSAHFSGEGHLEALLRWVLGLPQPAICAYEVGSYGYSTARFLNDHAVTCQVGSFVRAKGGRNHKTDDRDAQTIARLLFTHQFDPTHIPTPEQEERRAAARTRRQLSTSHSDTQRKAISLLTLAGKRHDSKRLVRKVCRTGCSIEINLGGAFLNQSFRAISAQLHSEHQTLEKFDKLMAREAQRDPTMCRLCNLPGIGAITAFTLVAEAMSFARFPTAKAYASYLGLVPSAMNSGGRSHQKRGRADTASATCLRSGAASVLRTARSRPLEATANQNAQTILSAAQKLSKEPKRGSHRVAILARIIAEEAWRAATDLL